MKTAGQGASLTMRDLARQLFALEANLADVRDPSVDVAVRVCEKLRVPLSQFAGTLGYSSLLSRALTLASLKEPALKTVQIRPDGSLERFDRLETAMVVSSHEGNVPPGLTLVVHLLELLVALIGESLAMSLLRDGWPNESFGSAHKKAEEKS